MMLSFNPEDLGLPEHKEGVSAGTSHTAWREPTGAKHRVSKSAICDPLHLNKLLTLKGVFFFLFPGKHVLQPPYNKAFSFPWRLVLGDIMVAIIWTAVTIIISSL